jgi:deoxycytidylate deaminase/adenylate kinase family enzyme
MTVQKKVIGLTGPFGSGCTTAADYISNKLGFKHIRLSDQLRTLWTERNPSKVVSRSELQTLGDELRETKSTDFLVRNALENVQAEEFVIDGIRNVGEIAHLRDRFGYHFTLFGIIPTFQARWERIGAKQNYPDDKEGQKAFFADDHRDQDEETNYGQQVGRCIDQADILIDNSENITLGAYKRKILDYANLAIGTTSRAPSREEIFMNMAYSACHSSTCVKRHVGALVVDAENNPIGIGYNENPLGSKSCVEEYHGCFKDIHKNEHLKQLAEETGNLYCPVCGTPFDITQGFKVVCSCCEGRGIQKTISDLLFPERGMTFCTAIHAEAWALSSAGERARNGELFSTTYPCFQCAEKIIHSGVKTVWYTEPYPDPLTSERLQLAGISLKQFEGVRCFDRMFASTRPR